jgi:hypothetical protein
MHGRDVPDIEMPSACSGNQVIGASFSVLLLLIAAKLLLLSSFCHLPQLTAAPSAIQQQ